MVTLVGTQTHFIDAVKELIELDFDAVEAYKAAISRLESEEYKNKLTDFLQDHERHVRELSNFVKQHDDEPPSGPSAKQYLTKGKAILAGLIGDKAILLAMRDNELDTNTAYERINSHVEKSSDAIEIVQRGLEDERRHKEWLTRTIVKL